MVLRASAEHLNLCAGSGDLFGPVGYDGAPPIHEQRCRWIACPYRDERWHRPQTGLREPFGDFPTALELCYCCASELISSGSKFSSFFCDPCRAAVTGLKDSVGRTVIPLGRHSIMNGLSLNGPALRDPRIVAAFASATKNSFDRMDRLFTWRRGVLTDHIAAMCQDARHVPAVEYSAFTAIHAAPKAEMFRQLCKYFQGSDTGLARAKADRADA